MSDDRTDIRRHLLRDGDVSVAILSLGCVTQDWRVPLNGNRVPVVLGYSDPGAYRHNPFFMGAIVGRVANRISGAGFDLLGQRCNLDVNEAPHHLHGGKGGLHAQNWDMEPDGDRKVILRRASRSGDQGYPGAVEFVVAISLQGPRLRYDMLATVDRPTPINLAQHSYYNLMGRGPVHDHNLTLAARAVTLTGAGMIPTGDVVALDGQPFDLRWGGRLGKADPQRAGLDLNFVLNPDKAAATLRAPNGLHLTLATDQPCLQIFTAPNLRQSFQPLADQAHVAFGGICLEPQGYPDAPNRPECPSIIVTPDHPYHQRLDVTIAAQGGAA